MNGSLSVTTDTPHIKHGWESSGTLLTSSKILKGLLHENITVRNIQDRVFDELRGRGEGDMAHFA